MPPRLRTRRSWPGDCFQLYGNWIFPLNFVFCDDREASASARFKPDGKVILASQLRAHVLPILYLILIQVRGSLVSFLHPFLSFICCCLRSSQLHDCYHPDGPLSLRCSISLIIMKPPLSLKDTDMKYHLNGSRDK